MLFLPTNNAASLKIPHCYYDHTPIFYNIALNLPLSHERKTERFSMIN